MSPDANVTPQHCITPSQAGLLSRTLAGAISCADQQENVWDVSERG